jgi:hypothetical protein
VNPSLWIGFGANLHYGKTHGFGKNAIARPSYGCKRPDARVSVGLAQLLVAGLHDQRMMHECGGDGSSEQPGKLNLTARRFQQVDAANHQVDSLPEIVDRCRKLVGPVSQSIADQQVAALRGRPL